MTLRRCGYCLAELASDEPLPPHDPDRCPCGRRAISRFPTGYVLTHAPGCDGREPMGTGCFADFDPVEPHLDSPGVR